MLKSSLVEKILDAIRARIPAGFEIFNVFCRCYWLESFLEAHQDAPGFDLRFIFRSSTDGKSTFIDFHDSTDGPVLFSMEIPNNHIYMASRSVLSSNGVGLFHSVSPSVSSVGFNSL